MHRCWLQALLGMAFMAAATAQLTSTQAQAYVLQNQKAQSTWTGAVPNSVLNSSCLGAPDGPMALPSSRGCSVYALCCSGITFMRRCAAYDPNAAIQVCPFAMRTWTPFPMLLLSTHCALLFLAMPFIAGLHVVQR
jgi:hypothetical protein